MGTNRRRKPAHLAEKLLAIRDKIDGGLSQNGLVKRLGLEDEFDQERVSKFERGILEPPLHVLCAYADLANVTLDVLARDSLDLPTDLPARNKSSGIPRAPTLQGTRTQTKGKRSR
jgi:transcriptional regulator with XRE-family HTH domain